MHAPITAIYAAGCALLILVLAARVVQARLRHRVGIGDAGHADLALRVRVHANAVEYVPLALLLILLLELGGTSALWIHALGGVLLFARLAHAIGLSTTSGTSPGRFVGTLLTWGVLLVSSGMLLFAVLWA
ncbi:MAG: MAPEG family protein [Lysobacteraceae bacterium]